MCSLNILQHVKCGHYLRYHRISIFFLSVLFLPIWTIFFCRVNPKMDDLQFAWILWYIWKGRNNKVFSNLDINPSEMLKLAELESTLWAEAHVIHKQRLVHEVQTRPILATPGRWCFTVGSWKDKDLFSGQSLLALYQVLIVY